MLLWIQVLETLELGQELSVCNTFSLPKSKVEPNLGKPDPEQDTTALVYSQGVDDLVLGA